ncbi:MAG: nitrous oxide reductase family maturation protein NosD, partial [Campylobacterota bacterium]
MFKILLLAIVLITSGLGANTLQEAINNAPSGSILKLPAGVYKGKITIDKPLTIIGKENGVIIN